MMLAFCFAALARDVGNSLVLSPDQIQEESFNHRQIAMAKLDTELAALLRYALPMRPARSSYAVQVAN